MPATEKGRPVNPSARFFAQRYQALIQARTMRRLKGRAFIQHHNDRGVYQVFAQKTPPRGPGVFEVFADNTVALVPPRPVKPAPRWTIPDEVGRDKRFGGKRRNRYAVDLRADPHFATTLV